MDDKPLTFQTSIIKTEQMLFLESFQVQQDHSDLVMLTVMGFLQFFPMNF